jgi:hypothetical protein
MHFDAHHTLEFDTSNMTVSYDSFANKLKIQIPAISFDTPVFSPQMLTAMRAVNLSSHDIQECTEVLMQELAMRVLVQMLKRSQV